MSIIVESAPAALTKTFSDETYNHYHSPSRGNPRSSVYPEFPVEKAYEGAYTAWLASVRASRLQAATEFTFENEKLFDVKLPQVPLTIKSTIKEANKVPAVDFTTMNSLFTTAMDVTDPTYHGCPCSLTANPFFNTAYFRVLSLSVVPSPKTAVSSSIGADKHAVVTKSGPVLTSTLSVDEAVTLAALLDDPFCRIKFIDLSKALDTREEPQPKPSAALIEEMKAKCAEEYGGLTETEQGAEKLQTEIERLKGEYTSYEGGLTFLANKQLERINVIFDALSKNTSVREVRLSQNSFGAPDEAHYEGRISQQPWNRLAKVIDENETIRILDCADNHCGVQGIGIIAKAMCKNIGIHTLDLSGNDLGLEPPMEEEDPEYVEDDAVFGEMYQGFEGLSELIKKNKFLRYLSLRNNYIKPEGVAKDDEEDLGVDTPLVKFLEPFNKYHRIRVLDLSNNELGDAGMRLLFHTLKDNKSIIHLDVSGNEVSFKGLTHLANLLNNNNIIQALIAQNNNCAPKLKSKKGMKLALSAAEAFSDALCLNKSLQVLNLSSNHLGAEASAVLLKRLGEASELSELMFDNNDLCGTHAGEFLDSGLLSLRKGICLQHSKIRVLSLSGNFLRSKGIQMLCEGEQPSLEVMEDENMQNNFVFVPTFSRLTHLDLSNNYADDDSLAALEAHFYVAGCKLMVLNLSCNKLTNVTPVARILQSHSRLHTLDISHNLIGGRLSPWQQDTISKIVSLKNVSLRNVTSDNTDDEANTSAFNSLLINVSQHSGLHSLNLAYNNLDDRHVNSILDLISNVSSQHPLQELYLCGNPRIFVESLAVIFQALGGNTTLKAFRISAPAHPGTGDQLRLAEQACAMMKENSTLIDFDCGLQMETAEEPEIKELQRCLMLNALKLPRDVVMSP